MSTPEQRAKWQALADAATPGEWQAWREGNAPLAGHLVGQSRLIPLRQPFNEAYVGTRDVRDVYLRDEDADFIAAAREAVPALLADVERRERERDEVHGECEALATMLRETTAHLAESENERDEARAKVERLRKALDSSQHYFTEMAEHLYRECTRLGAVPGDNMVAYLAAEVDRLRAWEARAMAAVEMALHEMDHHRVGEHNSARLGLRAVLGEKP